MAQHLDASLKRCSLADWDLEGRQLKLNVYEFALLDKQQAAYRAYLEKTPEDEGVRNLDFDELEMLESHFARLSASCYHIYI